METSDNPTTQEISSVETRNGEMLITSLDIKVTVHFEFVPQGQTVDQAFIWKY